jgi:hypothetical protein
VAESQGCLPSNKSLSARDIRYTYMAYHGLSMHANLVLFGFY